MTPLSLVSVVKALALLGVLLISSFCLADEPGGSPEEASTGAVARCVAEHEQARLLRVGERWFEARAQMASCARETCPLVIRSDCGAWLEELTRLVPTFLVVVERDDSLRGPVRLELDGRVSALSEPPEPIEAAPGRHRLRLTLASYPPIEREIVLRRGEKNQLVRVRFDHPSPPPREAPPSPPPPLRASRPVPVVTYVLSGAALAAFAGSGALLASALSSRSDARDSCAPACDSDRRESIETRLLLADASAGLGLLLGGLAVYTFARRPVIREAPPALAASIDVGRERSQLLLRARF